MKCRQSEIKKLLNNLSYCNDYIKYCKTSNHKHIISNTKFYDLKHCILEFILKQSQNLDITIGECRLQTQNDKKLILIPIIYDNDTYIFHQIYENIQSVILNDNIITNNGDEYERQIKSIEENLEKFKECITLLKQFVWNHYKYTLANSYPNEPMKYIKMVELCNKNIKFDIFINGGCMKYHITTRLNYKNNVVAQKPLVKIKKKMLEYIANR